MYMDSKILYSNWNISFDKKNPKEYYTIDSHYNNEMIFTIIVLILYIFKTTFVIVN